MKLLPLIILHLASVYASKYVCCNEMMTNNVSMTVCQGHLSQQKTAKPAMPFIGIQ